MTARKSPLLLACFGLLSIMGLAGAALPFTQPVIYPAYAEVEGLDLYASPAEYAHAIADRRYVMEKLVYTSDDLEVYAYVYRPRHVAGKRPAIIFNRGGVIWPSFAAELAPMANRLAQKGYIVIAPMYRGSGGAVGNDEVGGADLNDLFNLLPVLGQLGYVDTSQLYLYGESRGGMMVYQAIRDGFPARAATVFGAISDLGAVMKQNPDLAKLAPTLWPDLEQNRTAIFSRRSALLWADKINIPILIMHGQHDETVPTSQSLKMAEELSRLGKLYELVVMAGEGHIMTGRAAERDAHALRWFAKFAN